jgi:hypothetical protein
MIVFSFSMQGGDVIEHTNSKCLEVTLVLELLIISATQRTPQNMVSDTIMHVTLNTMNSETVT